MKIKLFTLLFILYGFIESQSQSTSSFPFYTDISTYSIPPSQKDKCNSRLQVTITTEEPGTDYSGPGKWFNRWKVYVILDNKKNIQYNHSSK